MLLDGLGGQAQPGMPGPAPGCGLPGRGKRVSGAPRSRDRRTVLLSARCRVVAVRCRRGVPAARATLDAPERRVRLRPKEPFIEAPPLPVQHPEQAVAVRARPGSRRLTDDVLLTDAPTTRTDLMAASPRHGGPRERQHLPAPRQR